MPLEPIASTTSVQVELENDLWDLGLLTFDPKDTFS